MSSVIGPRSVKVATTSQGLAHHVAAVQDGLSRLLGRSATNLELDARCDLAAMDGPQQFDLLVALDPSDPEITRLAQRMLRESKQALVAGILKGAPDDLSEFKFVRSLESAASAPALCFVSDGVWYLGNQVAAFGQRVSNIQKSHFIGDRLVATIFRPSDGNWARSAAEYRNEIEVLGDPPAGFETPRLLASSAEREPFWLVREKIEGRTLTEVISAGDDFDHQRAIRDVLGDLVALERRGLYHDDLRRHNVVLTSSGKARLIDFGSISRRRVDRMFPTDLFLALLAFVRQVSGRPGTVELPDFPASRALLLDVQALPDPYRGTFERFLVMPPREWSFVAFKQLLDREGGCEASSPSATPGVYLLAEHLRQAVAAHQKVIVDNQRADWPAKATYFRNRLRAVEQVVAENERAQWPVKAAYYENRLRATEAELVAVRETLSWKITAPLRLLKTGAKAILSAGRRLLKWLKRPD